MGLFFWKKNRLIDNFANAIADDLYSEVLPEMMMEYQDALSKQSESPDKKQSERIDRKLREIIGEIQQFRNIHKIGVYGKARLHLTFTERLVELGYDPKVAKKVNEGLILKTP